MRLIFAFAAVVMAASSAFAGTSSWHETTGGKLRLVTHNEADAQGVLRGMLEIRLDDGWTTYWKEPGETGVAPQISIKGASDARRVDLHFPAPERFDDGVSQWAGYEGHVRLPIEFAAIDDLSSPLTIDVFLGVCETICVPVQASLDVTPDADSGPIDLAEVNAAFAALPGESHDGFDVTHAAAIDDALAIDVEMSGGGGSPDIFLAGRDGLMLAAPEFKTTATGGRFTARIVHRGKGEALRVDYTLVSGGSAVSGLIEPD